MKKLFKTTTSFQHTVTTLSFHNHISTYTTTSVQHLKSLLPPKIIFFLLLHINLRETSFTDSQTTTIILPIHVQYNTTPFPFRVSTNPWNVQRYCTTHTSLIHIKKCHTRVEHRRPNICPHSILFDKQRNLRVMNTILSANQRWLFSDSSRGYWSPSRYKRIAASGNEIGWFLGFKSGTAVLTFTLCFLSSPLFSLFLPHFFLFLNI